MRGAIHTMEAILGSLIILIGITFIFPSQQASEISFSKAGYDCLEYLNQKGLLRYYTVNNMVTELRDNLKSCLPSVADFKFKICSSSDCSETTIPYDKTVYLSSYLIAGESTYNRELINLWLWSK